MTWRPISAFVHEIRARAAKGAPLPDDARAAAGALAALEYGMATVAARPVLVNLAALALATRERLVVHEIRQPVPDLVNATDLHSLPAEPPRMLQGPWILQVRDPARERLFGATAALAGYELDGVTYLVGLEHPEGARVALWRPTWPGGDLDVGTEQEDSPLVADLAGQEAWAREAARFAVVLGLLLDAAATPLRLREDGPAPAGRRHGQPRPATPWVTRRVYLDGIPRWGTDRDPEPGTAAAQGDRAQTLVGVRGHLKRQPYGPGGRERRWIYVAGYEARRWISPRPERIVVAAEPRRP